MTTFIQISIRDNTGTTHGPYHWKHVIEWHGLGLVDKFTWAKSENEILSIAELVKTTGVPSTISINSIFLAPSDDAKPAAKTILDQLYKLGFPNTIKVVSAELAEHLIKRLSMGDNALDAEDPEFEIEKSKVTTIASESVTKAPDATCKAPVESIKIEESVIKEALNVPVETAESKDSEVTPKLIVEAPLQQSAVDVDKNETFNLFLDGDLVGENEESDEGYAPVQKNNLNKLALILGSLVVVGATASVILLLSPKSTSETSEINQMKNAEVEKTTVAPIEIATEITSEIVKESIEMIDEKDELTDLVNNAEISQEYVNLKSSEEIETVVTASSEKVGVQVIPEIEEINVESKVDESLLVEEVSVAVNESVLPTSSEIVSVTKLPESIIVVEPTPVAAVSAEVFTPPEPQAIREFTPISEPEPILVSTPIPQPTIVSTPVSKLIPATSIDKTKAKKTLTPKTQVEEFPDYIPSF